MKRSSALQELTDAQLNCHMYRHRFNEPDIFRVNYGSMSRDYIWEMIHECTSCNVKRTDTVEPETFELYQRDYDYRNASGYLLSFAATMQDFRQELIRRRTRVKEKA